MQALDTFNTAVVSPIYYAMFTSLTILASAIMFKVFLKVNVWDAWGKSLVFVSNIILFFVMFQDWSGQSASDIVSVLCGFLTVLSGTMVLHSTRDPAPPPNTGIYMV